ncbi:ABC-type sugar transport system, periplasmic component [Rubrivivax sp. A210]|uniref:TIR domain-containing protein n=1 Tax=Rubrivivax sp. A210 TaxID=2772301 RepID=UPI00191B2363|nr:nucleotide-binding protein [Rubrivivax sp. A210]CAD5373992.1 ABC-type sugar transport system, periplasmic component [Rubrivivax sp. A210]
MQKHIAERLTSQVTLGWKVASSSQLLDWRRRLYAFLDGAHEDELAKKLQKFEGPLDAYSGSGTTWSESRDRQVGFLEGQIVLFSNEVGEIVSTAPSRDKTGAQLPLDPKKVFLVHGHDEAARESVARFLERLDLKVVILHEQPNEGKTVIEKFEQHSAVGFAVVLLTPDDVGGSALSPQNLQPRARQNVVLELGYFAGKLGRSRVCGLYRTGLEVPSDFSGVVLTELDHQGGWRTKLAQELVSASMKIDVQGLLQG